VAASVLLPAQELADLHATGRQPCMLLICPQQLTFSRVQDLHEEAFIRMQTVNSKLLALHFLIISRKKSVCLPAVKSPY
jgi:hypothetical protein